MAKEQEVSFLNPDNATAGLRNNIIGTIVACHYEEWDFKGKAKPVSQGNRTLSGRKFSLHLTLDDVDDGGKPEEIYWPGMPIEDCVPSDDGTSFEFITGRKGFPRDSELIQGVEHFIECGAVDKTELTNDPTIFVGKRCLFERKPVKWAKEGAAAAGKTPPDNLMPVKFVEDVGSGTGSSKKRGSGGAAAASAGSKKQAAAAEPETPEADEELTTLAVRLTREVLDDLPAKQKTISREDLGGEVLAHMLANYKSGPDKIDAATRKLVGALFEGNVFLEENAGKRTWKYDADDGEVTRVA